MRNFKRHQVTLISDTGQEWRRVGQERILNLQSSFESEQALRFAKCKRSAHPPPRPSQSRAEVAPAVMVKKAAGATMMALTLQRQEVELSAMKEAQQALDNCNLQIARAKAMLTELEVRKEGCQNDLEAKRIAVHNKKKQLSAIIMEFPHLSSTYCRNVKSQEVSGGKKRKRRKNKEEGEEKQAKPPPGVSPGALDLCELPPIEEHRAYYSYTPYSGSGESEESYYAYTLSAAHRQRKQKKKGQQPEESESGRSK